MNLPLKYYSEPLKFTTASAAEDYEVTGHPIAHLTMSMTAKDNSPAPKDIDVFVTLRHFDATGKESMGMLSVSTMTLAN